MGMMITVF